jgi:predicted porin
MDETHSGEGEKMKKYLLGTTALVAAGVIASAPANAAERLQAKLGGYMEQWFGYVNNDNGIDSTDYTGFDQKSDSEIWFIGSTKLDNGLEVGINVQLEANSNAGDQIDESYVILKGSFGEINIGSENSAGYKMTYTPREFGITINSGDQSDWVNSGGVSTSGYFRGIFGSVNIEPAATNDTEKLTYYTPRIGGFQLGVTYIPDASTQDANAQPNRDGNNYTDGFSVGANYQGKFGGGVELGVSGMYGFVGGNGTNTDDPTVYAFGVTLDVGGFNVGATYAAADDHDQVGVGNSGEAIFLGVSYATGPWGVALNAFLAERDGLDTGGVTTGHGEHQTLALSARYILGPGIEAAATLGYTEFSSDNTTAVADADGTYFVTGIRLSF